VCSGLPEILLMRRKSNKRWGKHEADGQIRLWCCLAGFRARAPALSKGCDAQACKGAPPIAIRARLSMVHRSAASNPGLPRQGESTRLKASNTTPRIICFRRQARDMKEGHAPVQRHNVCDHERFDKPGGRRKKMVWHPPRPYKDLVAGAPEKSSKLHASTSSRVSRSSLLGPGGNNGRQAASPLPAFGRRSARRSPAPSRLRASRGLTLGPRVSAPPISNVRRRR